MAILAEWDSGSPSGATTIGAAPTITNMGTYSEASFAQTSTADYFLWTFPEVTQYTVRGYVRTSASWATASSQQWRALSAADVDSSRFGMTGTGAPGSIRFYRQNGTQDAAANAPNNTIAFSTTYRIEYQVDLVNDQRRGAIFALGATSPLFDTGLVSGSVGDAFGKACFGKPTVQASQPEYGVSRLLLTDTYGSWLGRHVSDPVSTATPEVFGMWNGSSIEDVELIGSWNGSSVDEVELLTITQ